MLLVNCVGVLLYLWGASHGWLIPEERAAGIHTVSGEPVVWALFVFPVWTAFFVLNIIWAISNLLRRIRGNVGAYVLVSILWVVAVVIDYSQHGG
jgi:hypothetical protein